MDKIFYDEEVISDFPTGSVMFEKFQALRDELDKMEAERDTLLYLIHEIAAAADDPEELAEVIMKAKDFADNRPYPPEY